MTLPWSGTVGRIRLDISRSISRLLDAVTGTRSGESLFFVDRPWWRANLRPYLEELLSLGLTPAKLLDVGCGEGLLTSLYGILYPNAQVIGVDRCDRCVASARTIVHRLQLQNVRILHAECADLPGVIPDHTFDLITCRSVFGSCRCDRSGSVTLSWKEKTDSVLRTVHQLLRPDGVLVSTESDRGTADLWNRATAIGAARFRIDWERSCGAMTVLWARPVSPWPMVVARPSTVPTMVSATDVLRLFVGLEAQHAPPHPPIAGALAEAVFNQLRDDELVFGFQASRFGAILRRELHRAGAILVMYDQDDRHHRELSLWPVRGGVDLRRQLESQADAMESQGWNVSRFGSPPTNRTERDTA